MKPLKFTRQAFNIQPEEIRIVLASFTYFFCLLCGYYILRPVRDAVGITSGMENLPWLFTATFFTMLTVVPAYGWLCSRFTRSVFLPWVYTFFVINILVFYAFFEWKLAEVWTGRVFFVWLSVFNLFVVSVFWSLMADLFSKEQAPRLFGLIASGGSAGAILGPVITATLSAQVGISNLLLIAALFLCCSIVCIKLILTWHAKINLSTQSTTRNIEHDPQIGGNIFAGIQLVLKSRYLLSISVFILLTSAISTFLYLLQAELISQNFNGKDEQTQVFALIDLAVNILTVISQLFIISRLIGWLGTGKTLALIPFLMAIALIGLGIVPILSILIVAIIIRRTGQYSVIRPTREMLFTSVDLETKYKAKNFIDTVLYRAGDAISSWLYVPIGLFGILGIGICGACLAFIWSYLGFRLGEQHDQKVFN